MTVKVTQQLRKTLYVDADLLALWEHFKLDHPTQSFTGVACELLRAYLLAEQVRGRSG